MPTFFLAATSFPSLLSNLLTHSRRSNLSSRKSNTCQEYPLGRAYVNSTLWTQESGSTRESADSDPHRHRNESRLRSDILTGSPSPILSWNSMKQQGFILTVCCGDINRFSSCSNKASVKSAGQCLELHLYGSFGRIKGQVTLSVTCCLTA